MKFGKELSVKAVPEWSAHYITYKRLKRVLARLALQLRETSQPSPPHQPPPLLQQQKATSHNEETPLLRGHRRQTEEEDIKREKRASLTRRLSLSLITPSSASTRRRSLQRSRGVQQLIRNAKAEASGGVSGTNNRGGASYQWEDDSERSSDEDEGEDHFDLNLTSALRSDSFSAKGEEQRGEQQLEHEGVPRSTENIHPHAVSHVQYGSSNNSTDSCTSKERIAMIEQRNILISDSRKEFTAIIEADIVKVNQHFTQVLQTLQAAVHRLQEIDSVKEATRLSEGLEPLDLRYSPVQRARSPVCSHSPFASPDAVSSSVVREASVTTQFRSAKNRVSASPSSSNLTADLLAPYERLLSLYRVALQLRSFSVLNAAGFRKIMKKFDKQTGEAELESHQNRMLARLPHEPFQKLDALDSLQREVEQLIHYISAASGIPDVQTRKTMHAIQREVDEPRNENDENRTLKPRMLATAVILYLSVLVTPLPFLFAPEEVRAQRCAALLAFITALWVSEAIPFYVASLTIPVLVIVTGILADPSGHTLSAAKASKNAFSFMFNDTIMLILGGFTISAAFSKCGFELRLASFIQQYLGNRPRLFLLAFMFLGAFLSMWISNVAAPVLLTSLLMPIVHDIGSTPENRTYARALLLGLALACNIGGMMSPISSPQNAVALGFLEQLSSQDNVSFAQWLSISVPYCSLCLIAAWIYICRFFLSVSADDVKIPEIVYEKRDLTSADVGVLAVSFLTISLWCSLSYTRPWLGEMGTIAVIPLILFFGFGFLDKSDLFNFKWDLLLLVGGGSVLGSAVNSSRLLQLISEFLKPHLQDQHFVTTVATVLLIVFFITTFVSHTVAALILTPLIMNVGQSIGQTQLITMAATLMMSGTMSLPTSSFPNMNSLSQEDDFGRKYLYAYDFLKHGTVVSVVCLLTLNVFALFLMPLVFYTDIQALLVSPSAFNQTH